MDWNQLLKTEEQKDYFIQMVSSIKARREQGITVYPAEDEVFNAFRLTPFDQINVVIIGQDPYHGRNQAHG